MRTFKFRAWDTKREEFTKYQISYDGIFYYDKGKNCWCNTNRDNRFVLSQFTGLLDVYDFEIYEGDILIDREIDEICKIVFKDGSFIAEFSTTEIELSEVYRDLEFIGNIYANKDLLEE